MKTYIGTKIINATPMTRREHEVLRDWAVGKAKDCPGYLVEYPLVGEDCPNHKDFAGYISWSPAAAFESAYREASGLTFGLAVEAMKVGKKIARADWNNKGMWLVLVKAGYFDVGISLVGGATELLPWVGVMAADNKFVPWLASQTDILADDWMIV